MTNADHFIQKRILVDVKRLKIYVTLLLKGEMQEILRCQSVHHFGPELISTIRSTGLIGTNICTHVHGPETMISDFFLMLSDQLKKFENEGRRKEIKNKIKK